MILITASYWQMQRHGATTSIDEGWEV